MVDTADAAQPVSAASVRTCLETRRRGNWRRENTCPPRESDWRLCMTGRVSAGPPTAKTAKMTDDESPITIHTGCRLVVHTAPVRTLPRKALRATWYSRGNLSSRRPSQDLA